MLALDAEPNMAHKKLAELEQKGKLKAVITQNIDGLHQKAGSKEVLELHGSVHRNYCQKCHKLYDASISSNQKAYRPASAVVRLSRMWYFMKRD